VAILTPFSKIVVRYCILHSGKVEKNQVKASIHLNS
jgi:hypothetical protein